jgi:hypothetical protein
MQKFSREQKTLLGNLLAEGHRKFGKVAPRRPYRDDDGGEGGGSAQLLPEHPLLQTQPVGAPSDLTMLINESKFSLEEAEKRYDELNPQLQKSLENKLGLGLTHKPPKTPEARML